ncbi:hypothetical protein AX761_22670 [Rhizobium sp. 58]|nr:hypothetical protein AX761_22670 [Rhizobium sp. 58]
MKKILIALNLIGLATVTYYGWVVSSLLYTAGASIYGLFVALLALAAALDLLKDVSGSLRTFLRGGE